MLIRELREEDRPAWDAYVRDAGDGLPQHLSGWRDVLRRTYGYETLYLLAEEGERIAGVLPLFFVRSPLAGRAAMTMPGGLSAVSVEVANALIARARELAERAGLRRLVLRDTRQVWPGEWQTASRHVHWIVDLCAGAEALWKHLDGNIRRQIRLARRNGLRVEIDRVGERVGDFHDVLSRFTHQVGTPVFGRDFLEHVVEAFPGGFNIVMIYLDRRPIGAYFQLEMSDTVYGIWGASLRDTLELRPAYLAYWEILNDAASRGYRFLDMGRSPAGANTSRFKGQWGGTAHPVYQQVAALGSGRARPIGRDIPSAARQRWFTQIWSRLPFPVARFLGPKLRHHVPFA